MSNTAARKRITTHELTYIAVSAALMAVCSWISIPAPAPLVPFTLQTFAVFLILLLLGGRLGFFAILTYILLGAAGAPVFSGFAGGVGVLLGTTGGYILGFLFTALIYRAMEGFAEGRNALRLGALVLGLFVCYAFGTAWFMVAYARKTQTDISLSAALLWCVVPFLIPDGVKLTLAWGLAPILGKHAGLR